MGFSCERQLSSTNTNGRHGSVREVGSAMEPRVLKSWKDISAYLKVGISTAQRWERNHGLPVRRPSGKSGTAVVAFSNEIDWWLKTEPAAKQSDRTSKSDFDSLSTVNCKSPGSLEATIITNQLWSRPSRPPDLEAEIDAFREIARDMVTRDPSTVLNSLITHAVRLCRADSAGISLLEKDNHNNKDDQIFRWVAAKGAMEQYIGGTTPRNFSPCGICLERNCAQLFSHPERYYTYLQRILPMTELLLIPLYADNESMGTLWVMSHDGQRKFDREDARILSSLTDFTGLALRTLQAQQQHKADAQNRLLLEAIPGLVGTAEADGNASFFNERWLNYTGMSLDEARGWGWRAAIHPEDLPRYENAWRTALRTGEGYDVEYRLRRSDGVYRRQLGHVAPLRNSSGEVVLWLATSTDINDSKRTRTVSTESNDRERSPQRIVA